MNVVFVKLPEFDLKTKKNQSSRGVIDYLF